MVYSATVFETVLGWMALIWSPAGLRKVVLPQSSRVEVLHLASRSGYRAEEVLVPEFSELASKIKDYLNGKAVGFHCRLDFEGISHFQKRVYGVVGDIPRGQVKSYSWVAHALGLPNSARAVGRALAWNPFPIVVPCHRVVNIDCSLGGYSGGVALKKRLLELEVSQF